MGGARFPSREVKTGSEEYFGVPCPAVFVPTNRWSPEFTKRFGGLGNHFVGVVDLSGTSWTQSFFSFLLRVTLWSFLVGFLSIVDTKEVRIMIIMGVVEF